MTYKFYKRGIMGVTLAQEKLYTSEGRQEMLRRIHILKSHKYSDEECAVDLGITELDVKLLQEWEEFEDSLI